MKPYLEKLNKEQYKAATSIDGRNFILAGAGSGKTATLVARVAYMIDCGIDPNEILLLTFTNKAAKEMKDRIQAMIGEKAQGITACTFHSFCAIFIRKNAGLIGFSPDYTIIDSPDMMDALGICKQDFLSDMKAKGMEYDLKDFPTTKCIGMVYEAGVNNCVEYSAVIDVMFDIIKYKEEILDILARFKQYKKERNLLDYNDLLYFTEKLLANDEYLREKTDKHYKYISCDEYQDTNTVQNKILEHMTKDYPNLTVVGDDNQSIYAFRYANINNILDFEKTYPDCKTVVLDTNYRSSQEILDFCNAMMAYAKEGKKKELKGLFHGVKPCLVVKDDAYQEVDYIVKKILERDCDLEDIAVICRSASQTYLLEQRLNMVGIPFNKFGGLKFMEKAAIKDLLAFLRISVNIKDEIAMFRVLQLYPGIGKTYAQKISGLIATDDMNTAKEKYKKRAFAPYLDELEDTIKKLESLNLKEQLEFLIKDYYKATVERKIRMQNTTDGKKSEEYASLKESLEDAKTLYIMASKYRSTARFLADIVLDATTENENDEDKLNITTIHSAKGLEYKVVFVMDCIEGITPKCKENDDEDPEELRCMYVACTRAKEELYVLVPKYYNMRNIRGYISHFVNKIDILKTMRRNVGDSELLRLMQRPVYDF